MNAFRLSFNSSYVLLFNYIFKGIILKRKEIEIQWRKFGLKRSCISKVYALFWIFNLIFFINFKVFF